MKATKLTPAARRMIDTLPNDVIVYSLLILRSHAKARGTAVPSRSLYTPAQFKVWQRLKAQIQREKRKGAR